MTINPDEYLRFTGQQVCDADFSGRRLMQLAATGSVFERCRFERMSVEAASLGAGVAVSEFVDCSFDGSRMRMGGGFSRFVRCSFRNVRLGDWQGDYVELIDCVFTGRLRSSQFWGVPERMTATSRLASQTRWREKEGLEPPTAEMRALYLRGCNEFHGNDFSGAELVDVSFRAGVDLSLQRLPDGDDYLYVPDAAGAIDRAAAALARQPIDEDLRAEVDHFLRNTLARGVRQGQRQLLLRAEDFARRGAVPPHVTLALNLLRQASATP